MLLFMTVSARRIGTICLLAGLALLVAGITCRARVRHHYESLVEMQARVVQSLGLFAGHETVMARFTDPRTGAVHDVPVTFEYDGPSLKPPGETITVYYDPGHPQTVLGMRPTRALVSYGMMVLGLVLTCFGGWKRRAARRGPAS